MFCVDRDPDWCCFNDVLTMTDPVGGKYVQHERGRDQWVILSAGYNITNKVWFRVIIGLIKKLI